MYFDLFYVFILGIESSDSGSRSSTCAFLNYQVFLVHSLTSITMNLASISLFLVLVLASTSAQVSLYSLPSSIAFLNIPNMTFNFQPTTPFPAANGFASFYYKNATGTSADPFLTHISISTLDQAENSYSALSFVHGDVRISIKADY